MAQPINPDTTGNETTDNRIIGNDITFKKLIENSFSGITLLDKDFQTVYRSPLAEHIVGWSTADRMKKLIADLTHPADLEWVKQLLQGGPYQFQYRQNDHAPV